MITMFGDENKIIYLASYGFYMNQIQNAQKRKEGKGGVPQRGRRGRRRNEGRKKEEGKRRPRSGKGGLDGSLEQ